MQEEQSTRNMSRFEQPEERNLHRRLPIPERMRLRPLGHSASLCTKLKKSCKNIISPLGKENLKCFQRKASKEGFLFNSRRKNNATPLWLKVVKERHGIACQQQLRQTTMLI